MRTVKIKENGWNILDHGKVIGHVIKIDKVRWVYYNSGLIGSASSLKNAIEKVKKEMDLQQQLNKVLGNKSA